MGFIEQLTDEIAQSAQALQAQTTPASAPDLSWEERRELRRAFLRIMCDAGHGTFMEQVEATVSTPPGGIK